MQIGRGSISIVFMKKLGNLHAHTFSKRQTKDP